MRILTLPAKLLFISVLFLGLWLFVLRTEKASDYQNEKLSKKARIDLAMELEFQKTRDLSSNSIPRERLLPTRRQVADLDPNQLPLPLTWEERGPNNVGGRTRTILIDNANDPTNNTVFAGGVAGGLWVTTNFKAPSPTWTAIDDFFENIAVSAIAQDPTNPNIMYFGTGEGWFNSDAARGLGIWKSTNAGATWNQLASTDNPDFYRVQDITVDDRGNVYACTREAGLQRSTDGGNCFTEILSSNVGGAPTDRAADLEIGADGDIYVSLGMFSTGVIFKSDFQANGVNTGGPGTWVNISPAGAFNRIELGVAPSDANVIYASCQGDGSNDVTAIFRSDDQGASWTSVTVPTDQGSGAPYTRGQGWYDQIIAVDPNDPQTVYVGGIDCHRSTNGGNSWTSISLWFVNPNSPNYVHADQHQYQFEPGSSTNLILGTDGGVTYTTNANAPSPTFNAKNSGYNVTQFYACAISNEPNSNRFLGGTQDNGSQSFTMSGVNSTVDVTGGDGGFSHIDQFDPLVQIGSNQFANYHITNNAWNTSEVLSVGTGLFINPTDYDNNEKILYCVSSPGQYAFIRNIGTTNDPGTRSIPEVNVQASAITVSPNVANRVYLGSNNGRIFRLDNAHNSSVTTTEITANLPGGPFTSCVAVENGNENHLMVTFSNFGANSVWESTNGGASWTSVEGNLPDMPVRWAVFSPNNSDQALLATEMGVWSTDNLNGAATNWGPSNIGLANTRVDMLQFNTVDNQLIAGTHGRGFFTSNSFSDCPGLVAEVTNVQCNGENNGAINLTINGGTPPINFSWSNGATTEDLNNLAAGNYGVTVSDASGECNLIRTFNISEPAPISITGIVVPENSGNDGAIDITVEGGTPAYGYAWSNGASTEDINNLAEGTYTVTVTDANDCTEIASFEVINESGCTGTIAEFPYEESFESGLGIWGQAPGDDFDWTRNSGSTPTGRTGPNGAADGTFYLYAEASGNIPAKRAILTGCFDFRGLVGPEITYSYNMYGSNIGSLAIEVLDVSTEDITTVWSATGDQGAFWRSNTVSLAAFGGREVEIRFVSTTGIGGSDRADIGIDDILVDVGAACEPPVLSISSTDASCSDSADGTATVVPTGGIPPYTYLWSNGQTTATATNLSAGTYSVTVTDADECPAEASTSVNAPPAINLEFFVLGETTEGASDGEIDLTVTGGTPPYSYSWSNGASSQDITGLSAGIYSVTVTDNSGCEVIGSVEVFVGAAGSCNGEGIGLPVAQNFEVNLGDWENFGDFDFVRNSGGTSTRRTGPSSAFEGNFYGYAESNGNLGEQAILASPCLDLTGVNASITFAYHMLGSTMGSLSVEVGEDGGAPWEPIFTRSGNQGSNWFTTTLDLSTYSDRIVRIRFVATIGTGSAARSDIALDDISIFTSGSAVTGRSGRGFLGFEQPADQNEEIAVLSMMPVPTSDYLTISLSSLQDREIVITVLDYTGKVAITTTKELSKGKNLFTIDSSDLSSGLYFLSIQSGKLRTLKKFEVLK